MIKNLVATAAAAITLAAPAHANTAEDMLRGVLGVIIIKELIEHADSVTVNTVPVHTHTTNTRPQRGEVCYTEIDETQSWIVIRQMDCYGARVSTSRHRKY